MDGSFSLLGPSYHFIAPGAGPKPLGLFLQTQGELGQAARY